MIELDRIGTGAPLLCIPGGPLSAVGYLGTLGGMDAERTLLRANLPHQRADVIAAEVERTRDELGLDRFDLLGHSAGAAVAFYYAARHPQRLRRLVLVTPSTRALGIAPEQQEWEARIQARRDEPWFAEAYAALQAWDAGDDSPAVRVTAAPFFYGRWDETAAAHASDDVVHGPIDASEIYYAEGRPDPEQVRAALGRVEAPVLITVGGLDPAPDEKIATALAELFGNAEVLVQAGAGHFPWLDDAEFFRTTTLDFLR